MKAYNTSGQLLTVGATGATGPTGDFSRSFTLESPVVGDKFTIWTPHLPQTISRIEAFVRGSSSPSVTWKLKKDTDPTAAGTAVITVGTTTTVTTSIQQVTAFDSSSIAADTALWIEITAVSGTVTELHLTIHF